MFRILIQYVFPTTLKAGNVYISIIGASALIIIAALLFAWGVRRSRNASPKPTPLSYHVILESKLTDIEEGDDHADRIAYELFSYVHPEFKEPLRDPSLHARYQAAHREYHIRVSCHTHRNTFNTLVAIWRDETKTKTARLFALDKLLENYGSGLAEGAFERLCKEAEVPFSTVVELTAAVEAEAAALYDELLLKAGDDTASFMELEALLKSAKAQSYGSGLAKMSFSYPRDWNTLVVRHYDVPPLDSFVGQRPAKDIPAGEISRRLEEAVKARDLVKCAICLAYCHASKPVRTMVGDILYADVIGMFVTLKAELVSRER